MNWVYWRDKKGMRSTQSSNVLEPETHLKAKRVARHFEGSRSERIDYLEDIEHVDPPSQHIHRIAHFPNPSKYSQLSGDS